MTYDIYPPLHPLNHGIWIKRMIPLLIFWKKCFILNSTIKKRFTKPILTSAPPITYNYDALKFSENTYLTFPSVSKFHKETNTCPPKPLLETKNYSLSPPPSPLILHNWLTNSDCLFLFVIPLRILWKNVGFSFRLIMLKQNFWICIQKLQVIVMLPWYHDI